MGQKIRKLKEDEYPYKEVLDEALKRQRLKSCRHGYVDKWINGNGDVYYKVFIVMEDFSSYKDIIGGNKYER